MSDKTIELNRRRVLGGMITIGGAAAAAGAGTFAYFSDSEESTNNQISAASLDLAIDGQNDTATTTVTASEIVPSDSGSDSSELTNNGSIDGYLDVEITNVSSNTLTNNLEIRVLIDDDNDTSTTGDQSVVVDDTANNIGGDYDVNHLLPSGNTSNLVIEYNLPSSVTDGEGETVSFDVVVMLDQTDTNQ